VLSSGIESELPAPGEVAARALEQKRDDEHWISDKRAPKARGCEAGS